MVLCLAARRSHVVAAFISFSEQPRPFSPTAIPVSRSSRSSATRLPKRSNRNLAAQANPRIQHLSCRRHQHLRKFDWSLFMAAGGSSSSSPPDWDSLDPWRVLGISNASTMDAKEVKRVYKRLAMKYHPDVATTKDSSAGDKKAASDRFAKINWAYSTIVDGKAPASSSSSSRKSTGWEPPHRRTGAYTSSSSSSSRSNSDANYSTDWRDYIPNKGREEVYDSNGDSFGKILSDLMQGGAAAVGGVSGGAGVFKDFVDFLEQNVEAYSPTSGSDDAFELRVLLQTGSIDDIGEEMDETELVVQQLTNKQSNMQNELVQIQADLAIAVAGGSYLERMKQQERCDEINAQKTVVEGYLKRARTRLVSLQTRYKELIVSGQNDRRAGGGRTANRQDSKPQQEQYQEPRQTRRNSATTESNRSTSKNDGQQTSSSSDESWKGEGFGSFGRGSSRRGGASRNRQSSTESSEQQTGTDFETTRRTSASTTSTDYANKPRADSQASEPSSSSSSSSVPNNDWIPPHRRQATATTTTTTTTSYGDKKDSERRLRELKVDEEFDKLKRDLGLK